MQELEEKEQARILVVEEKTLTRIARENASTRLSSLQQELEMEHKLVMDRKARLMQQLSDLKLSSAHLLDYGISEGESSQNFIEKIPDHRRCTICCQKEVSILFIPCAHQVVCFDCCRSMGDSCPSCQVQIAKKYVVYN
ncbi:hypothetical protein ACH5RR_023639 [Cinchona calisaya]|uniref:RING-type domain-containing protein n=1 Tax=Cinchona calisaya TaxID=153742 RepID=A0ABD2ZF37_9GENT